MATLIEKSKHMTEVLLQQLSNSDIQWMIDNGHRQQVAAGTVLIQQHSNVDYFYLVLEGTLSASIKSNQNSSLAKVYGKLEDDPDLEQEITRFRRGEVIGESSGWRFTPSAITVKAEENSVVLAIPSNKLLENFRQDTGFANRFYRAIAILLLDRFERLVKTFKRRQNLKIPPLHDAPLLFGKLSDSDVDWFTENGHVKLIAPNIELIQAGRPLEYLYILLRGKLSVFVPEGTGNPLARAFEKLEGYDQSDSSPATEIASSSRAEIIGETALIDARLPIYTFKGAESSQVLKIEKQRLTIRLQENPGMGARFYRVIAMLLSARLQGLIDRLGYGRGIYRAGQDSLSEGFEYEGEIDWNVLDDISLGGARFERMLKRLGLS